MIRHSSLEIELKEKHNKNIKVMQNHENCFFSIDIDNEYYFNMPNYCGNESIRKAVDKVIKGELNKRYIDVDDL